MPDIKPTVSVGLNKKKHIKGYKVTHPKGHTYFISSLGALKITYGLDEEGLKQIGWNIEAVEG